MPEDSKYFAVLMTSVAFCATNATETFQFIIGSEFFYEYQSTNVLWHNENEYMRMSSDVKNQHLNSLYFVIKTI